MNFERFCDCYMQMQVLIIINEGMVSRKWNLRQPVHMCAIGFSFTPD